MRWLDWMSGSGVFDVSRLCDTVVIRARRTVGCIIDLDSKKAFRAERVNSVILMCAGAMAARDRYLGVAEVRCARIPHGASGG